MRVRFYDVSAQGLVPLALLLPGPTKAAISTGYSSKSIFASLTLLVSATNCSRNISSPRIQRLAKAQSSTIEARTYARLNIFLAFALHILQRTHSILHALPCVTYIYENNQ